MRHKYRAWDKIDKLMYCDIHRGITFDDGSEYSFADFLDNKGYHEWIIMQFTGLKYKDKEIYVGDGGVCSIGGYPQTRYIVKLGEYDEDGKIHFGFYIDWLDDTGLSGCLPDWLGHPSVKFDMNIHSNPELLKK